MNSRGQPRARVDYLNPLTRTLAHYVRELEETLERCGVASSAVPARATEGERGARGKAVMAWRGIGNVREVRGHQAGSIALWPMFGLYDIPMLSFARRPAAVILHDPSPITEQVGYGRVARWLARAVPPDSAPLVVVHSVAAEHDAREILPNARMTQVLHPVLSQQQFRSSSGAPTALVAGQYKPSRDMALLEELGPLLRSRGIEPLAVGRGWSGRLDSSWRVEDRFVPDDELDVLMGEAAAVVIPYQRYYQSGVAIRALELGTPSVGIETSFLRDVFGDVPYVLPQKATARDVADSVAEAASGKHDMSAMFSTYRDAVDASWAPLIGQLDASRSSGAPA